MPMRSASSTCVSFRCRRSWRILRPTSSSCAGLFMPFPLTLMLWEKKLRPLNSTGLHPRLSSPEAPTYRNAHLLRELVKRDFAARFTGSALGLFWAVLQPLSLVVVYWFVFTYMFTRGPSAANDGYIRFLITGLIPWLAINEGVVRSTTGIVENAPMVRRLSFRSELLV